MRKYCADGYIPSWLLSATLPPLVPGITLAELDLPGRAWRFFEEHGWIRQPELVTKNTIGDLAKTRGLGTGSIVAIVEALYRCADRHGLPPDRAPGRHRKRSSANSAVAAAPFAPADVREKLKSGAPYARRINECRMPPLPPDAALADLRLSGRALSFFQQSGYAENPAAWAKLTVSDLRARFGLGSSAIADIVEAIYRCTEQSGVQQTLEEEVLLWLVPKGQQVRRLAISQYYGFKGRQACSLTAVGASLGYTRERIKQLCFPRSTPPTVVLQRFQAAIEIVCSSVPIAASAAEVKLVERRLVEPGARLETLLKIAKLLHRDPGFVVQEAKGLRRAVRSPGGSTDRLRAFLIRLAKTSPVLQTNECLAAWNKSGEPLWEASQIEQVVDFIPNAYWVDRTTGWFWLDRESTSLRLRIQKALAAAGRLSPVELRAAAWRGQRLRRMRQPPLAVFREFCRRLPECRLANNFVRAADPDAAWRQLQASERTLVEYLLNRGGACPLAELRTFSRERGISDVVLRHIVQRSAALKSYKRAWYGVPGLPGDADSV